MAYHDGLVQLAFNNMEVLGEHVDHLVFLYGHAKGALDEVWSTVFASDVQSVKQLPLEVCFERAVLLPKATPLWNTDAPIRCTATMDRFVHRVQKSITEQVCVL